jgi:hypothetical protein
MRKTKKKAAKKKPAKRKAVKKAAKKKVVKKVRCAATTKDGKRCKRMVSPPSKFCHLHKGWKPKTKKKRR